MVFSRLFLGWQKRLNAINLSHMFSSLWNTLKQKLWGPAVIREGNASRLLYFYPGEEGSFVENVHIRLFSNGVVHVRTDREESHTHLQNCEIIWYYREPQTVAPPPTKGSIPQPANVRSLQPRSSRPKPLPPV